MLCCLTLFASRMTGTMTQLGYLASYATEMLSDLKELADTTHKRVENCTKRTRKVRRGWGICG